MSNIQTADPVFKFISNCLCLDFANTVHNRMRGQSEELLNSYTDLVRWSELAQTVTEDEALHLLETATLHPTEASVVLAQAIVLREAIYRIFQAVIDGAEPVHADIAVFNEILADAMVRMHITLKAGSFTWSWMEDENALDRMLWPVARSAADLLTSSELALLHVCAAPDCSWLFLDTSKNHSRRWCDMEICGNRAKVRRHYAQKKQLMIQISETKPKNRGFVDPSHVTSPINDYLSMRFNEEKQA